MKNNTQAMENKKSMRLNKYLSNCGIATRRDADTLIKKGLVKVNGKTIKEMGFQVTKGDEVLFDGEKLAWPVQREYILINKPKNCFSIENESQKDVIQILENLEIEKLESVDILEKDDLGLLLITNDAYLLSKLRNPSLELKQIFLVELDKELDQTDFDKILSLKNQKIEALAYTDDRKKNILGLEVYFNDPKLVRQIFEELDYTVVKIDRTTYGNLTKKDLPRSKWKFVSEKEIGGLKRLI